MISREEVISREERTYLKKKRKWILFIGLIIFIVIIAFFHHKRNQEIEAKYQHYQGYNTLLGANFLDLYVIEKKDPQKILDQCLPAKDELDKNGLKNMLSDAELMELKQVFIDDNKLKIDSSLTESQKYFLGESSKNLEELDYNQMINTILTLRIESNSDIDIDAVIDWLHDEFTYPEYLRLRKPNTSLEN